MRYSIEQQTLDEIIQYLITKPYKEVAKLLLDLQNDVMPINEDNNTEESIDHTKAGK